MIDAFVLGFAVGGDQVLAAVVGAVASAPLVLGAARQARREVADTWRDLATAKDAKLDEQSGELADLKARVAVLESDFVERIAVAVAAAMREERSS